MATSIIGTAKTTGNMNEDLFQKMCYSSLSHIKGNELVSGGAAWGDHVAVALFLGFPERFSLVLHLPCPFEGGQYKDNGSYDWRVNPGRTSNSYHRAFSKAANRDSLEDIQRAIALRAKVIVYDGFHKRNDIVAESPNMIAFTWGLDQPEDGGTKYTWDKCKTSKVHISLARL